MTRAAAVCSLFLGLGFGIPGVLGTRHFARTGEVWQLMGFPTYGDGPFTRWGLPTSTPLLVAFVAVCAAEVAVGVALWVDWGPAPWISLVLLPVELFFWVGFALPFGFVAGLARTALVAAVLVGD